MVPQSGDQVLLRHARPSRDTDLLRPAIQLGLAHVVIARRSPATLGHSLASLTGRRVRYPSRLLLGSPFVAPLLIPLLILDPRIRHHTPLALPTTPPQPARREHARHELHGN